MPFGPIEMAWLAFVFVGVPMLGLYRMATVRDQPPSVAWWGVLSALGFVVGAVILLRRPQGENRRSGNWDGPEFTLR